MKIVRIILILLLAGVCTACGFTLRNSQQLPSALHKIYLITPNPEDRFIVELQRQLKSLSVAFVQSPTQASVILEISRPKFNSEYPILFNGAQSTSYTYTLQATYKLSLAVGGKQQLIKQAELGTSVSISHSANQFIITSEKNQVREQLDGQLVQVLYAQLSSHTLAEKLDRLTRPRSRHHHAADG